jgi:hypothetical protein
MPLLRNLLFDLLWILEEASKFLAAAFPLPNGNLYPSA